MVRDTYSQCLNFIFDKIQIKKVIDMLSTFDIIASIIGILIAACLSYLAYRLVKSAIDI